MTGAFCQASKNIYCLQIIEYIFEILIYILDIIDGLYLINLKQVKHSMIIQIIKYLFVIAGIIILYEVLRSVVKAALIKRLTRSVKQNIKRHGIKIDKHKFMNKFVIKHELMNDADIHNAILAHAKKNNLAIQDVDEIVEEYIEEIIPFFNLLSYYKIGYWVANFFLNLIYEVVIDKENREKLKNIPRDSAVVFVMNHRSNVDYILVAYMLAQNISISYAVGEWARVWPLEYIFKSFGAYFLRRKYREDLYHIVLEKYIQMISVHGVTQGIFIEGGLSRDGNFRESKIGLLDYIVKIKEKADFKNDIVFIPVGINYDWVLEDKVLISEWKNNKEKTGFLENISSLARIIAKGPFLSLINIFKYLTGKIRHHGYACVSFGDPVSVSGLLKENKDFFKKKRGDRLKLMKNFADQLLEKIGSVVPVTPVCLTAKAIMMMDNGPIDRNALINKVILITGILKKNKRRIIIGKEFKSYKETLVHLQSEKINRRKELVFFEQNFLDVNEARNFTRIALEIMKRRKFITIKNNTIIVNESRRPFIEYYANLLNYYD